MVIPFLEPTGETHDLDDEIMVSRRSRLPRGTRTQLRWMTIRSATSLTYRDPRPRTGCDGGVLKSSGSPSSKGGFKTCVFVAQSSVRPPLEMGRQGWADETTVLDKL